MSTSLSAKHDICSILHLNAFYLLLSNRIFRDLQHSLSLSPVKRSHKTTVDVILILDKGSGFNGRLQ